MLGAALYSVLIVVLRAVPRHDCLLLPLGLFAAFRFMDREPAVSEKRRPLLLLGVTVVLLTGVLLQLWTVGYEGRSAVVGGIVPWSDSHDYASDALRLLHGEKSSDYSTKRPFFAALLSGLLRLCGGNLRASLVLLMLLGAASIVLVTCEVWRTHGYKSAWLVFLVLYFFERRWTGFVQTEHLGLPLGAIAFIVCWRMVERSAKEPATLDPVEPAAPVRPWAIASVLFALALGLLARPGPFFVLPALLYWAARKEHGRQRLRVVAFGAVAIGVAFAMNRLAVARLGSGAQFWDYPRIIFGMLHGEDHLFFCRVHPEICALPMEEQVAVANRVLVSDVTARPSLLVTAFGGSLLGYLFSPQGLFSFVWYNPDERFLENGPLVKSLVQADGVVGPVYHWYRTHGAYSLLNALGMGVVGAGFTLGVPVAMFKAFRRRKVLDRYVELLLFANVGLLASAPFLPPSITPTLQTGCATIAFLAALPAILFFGAPADARASTEVEERESVVWAPVAAFGVAFLLVLLVRWAPLGPAVDRSACADPKRTVLHVLDDTVIEVKNAEGLSVGKKSLRDLDANLTFMKKHFPEVVASIEPAKKEGTVIAYAYDWCQSRARIVIDDQALTKKVGESWISAQTEGTASWHILRLTDAQPLPMSAR